MDCDLYVTEFQGNGQKTSQNETKKDFFAFLFLLRIFAQLQKTELKRVAYV